VLLRINPDYGYVVGIDVGETRIRGELFDLTMAVRANADIPLEPREHGVDVVVDRILRCLSAVLADSGVPSEAILGVGIGVPGVVEHGPEVVLYGQTYGWDAVPLERLLRAGTDLPLYIDNGANTMGQSELWFGAGQGARRAVVCLIGSGVGASIIGNGVAERPGGYSGTEWGHTTVVVGGRDCRCGSLGHLEAYVGAEAILERYGLPLPGDDEESALAALIDLAETSPEAAKVLDETALYLGAGIGDLINLFSPDRIILGGWAGLLLGHHMLPAIRASAREHALTHPFAETTITVGRLGPDAVALGAATLPIQAFLNGTAAPAARRTAATDDIRPTGTGRVG
jgi:predicted NBD/HSP70 family sugar kinase